MGWGMYRERFCPLVTSTSHLTRLVYLSNGGPRMDQVDRVPLGTVAIGCAGGSYLPTGRTCKTTSGEAELFHWKPNEAPH